MALMPKRVRHRKSQRGRIKGEAQRGNRVVFGDFGLQTVQGGWIKAQTIESGRIAAQQYVRGEGRLYIRIFPHKSITGKPLEVRMGTGVLNRLLRAALEETPPPMIGTKRLKLFYAAQTKPENERELDAVRIVLFVNQPKLLADTYSRYLERRIRAAWPSPGLPIIFSGRARSESEDRPAPRSSSRRR